MDRTTSPGRCARPSGMFFHQPDKADHIRIGPAQRQGFSSPPATTPAPPMSIVISSIPAAGLMEMPPVSNTTPLPTKASRRGPFGPALPLHHHNIRRRFGPLPHAQKRAHPQFGQRALFQNLNLYPQIAQVGQAARRIRWWSAHLPVR